MAYTIEQLQAFSNTKPELRYITEEIIDYLQANPAGGSSYLVYTALLTQTDGEHIGITVLEDTIGVSVLLDGSYYVQCGWETTYDRYKIYIQGVLWNKDEPSVGFPIMNNNGVYVGRINLQILTGKIFEVDVFDSSGDECSLTSLVGSPASFSLPEIRIYL
jgi:hypothetical protein